MNDKRNQNAGNLAKRKNRQALQTRWGEKPIIPSITI